MASRTAFNAMGGLPVKTVQAYEGTLTRYTDSVSPRGGTNEGAAVYSAPIVKGDFVKVKDHAVQGQVLVERSAAGDELVHGMAVASPQGIDNTTVSGQTPAAALRRLVDVAFFGVGIIEVGVSATGAVAPGDVIGFDADERNEVETQIAYGSVATGDQGKMVALSYSAAGSYVAVLVGASCFIGN
jgi:hypothetical protein